MSPTWKAPKNPGSLSHPPVVQWNTHEMVARRLLHQLAQHGVLTVEAANAAAEYLPKLMPSPERVVLLSVDLDQDRNALLRDLTYHLDFFQKAWKDGRPANKGGRPPAVPKGSADFTRSRLLDEIRAVEGIWPEIATMKSADKIEARLFEVLWKRPNDEQVGFGAAGLVTVFTPLYFPPSEPFLAALGVVAPAIANNRIRKANACVEIIWAEMRGVDQRTIQNLYPKKPPQKTP